MKSAVESLEPTRVKVTVEAPYEDLKAGIDAAYKKIAGQINVPGFRRGKVPPRIIDQRVGRGAVLEQAIDEVLPGLYNQAVRDNHLHPLSQPEVSVEEIPAVTGPLSGQLTFTAEVDVRPEITLPKFSEITLEVESVEVSDDDVEEALNKLRDRFGSLVGVDRPAADGDFVTIDLVATIGEEEIESVSGISYQVGTKTMIDGLDEALVGMSAGESTTFVSRLVGGEHADEDADVTVTLENVKVRELPDADDDFAQLASEFDTIEELREDLRGEVTSEKASNQALAAREKLMEHLREVVTFPLPQRVIDAEIAAHLEREGKEADDPHAQEIREETANLLRDQLLLDELAERTRVDVSQDELLQFLFNTAQQYGVDPTQFITAADQNGQIPLFIGELRRSKSVAVALRRVAVTDTSGAQVDLSEFLGEDTEAEAAAAKEMEEAAAAVAEAPEAAQAPVEEAPEAPEAPAEEAPAKKPAAKKPAAKKAATSEE